MKRRAVYFAFGLIVAWGGISLLLNGWSRSDAPRNTLVDTANAQTALVADSGKPSTGLWENRQNAITRAVAATEEAVVSVNVIAVEIFVRRIPFGGGDPFFRMFFPEMYRDQIIEKQVKSLGSGFIISPDGYIVTNHHVVQNAKEIMVSMMHDKNYKAKLVGVDEVSDVALLKIEGKEFPYIEMGNSDDIIIGEWVIAMGNPFGLFAINNEPTVTVGVVSAKNRDFGYLPDARKVYQDMIQTDASINSGNSGGPLVNATGRVIGMNTFIYTGGRDNQGSVGIGFAIPINRIKKIVAQLQSTGSVDRQFYTGIEFRSLSAYWAARLGLSDKPVVVITYVDPASPAAQAGVKVGDVIVRVNGKKIQNDNDILAAIYEKDLKVGDQMELTLQRDGKIVKVRFKLIALDKH
jgi:serine protease Do